jgi:hypothetical protein
MLRLSIPALPVRRESDAAQDDRPPPASGDRMETDHMGVFDG